MIEKVSRGLVFVRFEDGQTRKYDKDALATGKLTLLVASKHMQTQSVDEAIATIKNIKKAQRDTASKYRTSDFVPGQKVSHHFRGLGVVEEVQGGKVSVRYRKGDVHTYSNDKLGQGKLGIVGETSRSPQWCTCVSA